MILSEIHEKILIENVSIERLNSYKLDENDTVAQLYERYLFNIKVAESFYPPLSVLEIALRNRLYNAVSAIMGNNWLLDEVDNQKLLSDSEHKILVEADKTLRYRYSKPPSTGALIAELTFGFWVNLCKKSYKNSLWDKQDFFNSVFPDFDNYFHSPSWDKTKVIFPELKMILILRNRIFHHEIIINNKNGIENCYNTLIKILSSLSKDYAQIFEDSFRFQDIIKQKP